MYSRPMRGTHRADRVASSPAQAVGYGYKALPPRPLCGQEDDAPTGLFVTPRDIDSRVRELGRLIGRGLSLALQPGLSAEEVAALLG